MMDIERRVEKERRICTKISFKEIQSSVSHKKFSMPELKDAKH